MTIRIAMWSGPRNLSTAMMRSFGSRADTFVSDEPFYGCFLKTSGAQHPMREETITAMECDWNTVMKREFKVEANVGAPQVAYREYLAKPIELTYTHKKQSGGSGQFAEIRVSLTPGERGSGFQFIDEIKGGNIPREYIPSVEKGMTRWC